MSQSSVLPFLIAKDMHMIRSDHFWYDLRNILGSTRLLVGLLVVAGFFTFFVSLQLVYIFIVIIAVILGGRGAIGRRCPKCDAALQQQEAEKDENDVYVLWVIWRCPRDGYQEKEKVKGSGGLFGAN